MQNGGGRGPWGSRDPGAPGGSPDLEQFLKRSQDKLKQVMPGGGGPSASFAFLAIIVVAAIAAFYAFTFRVSPDELGVVLHFGKVERQEPPGLHFRMPTPSMRCACPR